MIRTSIGIYISVRRYMCQPRRLPELRLRVLGARWPVGDTEPAAPERPRRLVAQGARGAIDPEPPQERGPATSGPVSRSGRIRSVNGGNECGARRTGPPNPGGTAVPTDRPVRGGRAVSGGMRGHRKDALRGG